MIDFSATTEITPTGARVEVATVTHEGHPFTALGSVIDEARGEICAYVSETNEGDPRLLGSGRDLGAPRFRLSTWEGTTIAALELRGRWTQRGFGGVKNTITAWRATVGGRVYSGRNSGPGMFLRMRAGRVE
jgi:hypothetical protein